MSKIKNDKYYTSEELAQYCVNKTKEIIGEYNISEFLEPSAGAGVFLNYLPKNTLAYDLEPENDRIIKQDYLTLKLDYKKGRCIIGNPPFGSRNNLSLKFFKKSILLGDYIAFIQPISQLDNTQKMYEFDLIYSENLGIKKYSDIELHCCFNIYKRPDNGLHTSPINYKLQDVTVTQFTRGGTNSIPQNYDFSMCTWGNGSCGKENDYIGQYAQEHYIIINNSLIKDKVLKVCKETNWKNLCPSISSKKLQTWRIYKHLKEQIPELK